MRLPILRSHNALWRYLWRGLKISILLIVLMWLYCAAEVYRYGRSALPDDYQADVAVVLGAAAWDVRPSPVYRERLNHAITLYQRGKVLHLAFTGGTPKPGFMTEADVGKRYALRQGVPERDMVLENTSRNTYENLVNIRPLLRERGWTKAVIVSDPYHLARAAAVARDLGMNADFSATPTTRYTDTRKKLKFAAAEATQLFAYYWWQIGHNVF
ncbi:MAG: YdcF family protein [Neisseria sp.]|nr:YdcF family protein [Neisseria sp.]